MINICCFTDEIFENGSKDEVEIRGCSIHAVELVNEEIQKQLLEMKTGDSKEYFCNSIIIDHFMWDYRRQYAGELSDIPFHKTLSVYY